MITKSGIVKIKFSPWGKALIMKTIQTGEGDESTQSEIQTVKLEAIWIRFDAEFNIAFDGFVWLTVTTRQELGTICPTLGRVPV